MKAKVDAPTWANVFEKKGLRPTVHVLSQGLITEGILFTAVRNIAQHDGNVEPRIVLVPANEQSADRAGRVLSSFTSRIQSPGVRRGVGNVIDVFAPYAEMRKNYGPTVETDALLGRFFRTLDQYGQEYSQGASEFLEAIAALGAANVARVEFEGWKIPATVLEPGEVTILWNPDIKNPLRVEVEESFTARNLRGALPGVPYDNTIIVPGQYGTFVEVDKTHPGKLSGPTDDAVSSQGLVMARLVNAQEVHLWTATGTEAPDVFSGTQPRGTDIRVIWSPLDPLGQTKISQEIFSDAR